MSDLFATSAPAHDPGGKVRHLLDRGVDGFALISDCQQYRSLLIRRWDLGNDCRGALWIGMNPSTADATVDDPTVRREIGFTRRLGLGAYVKCNVMDYRATDPKRLLDPGVAPCSPKNVDTIIGQACIAEKVIACWGALPKVLKPFAETVERRLDEAGIYLWCLGTTADGSPRHPLYVKGDTPLVRFKP